MWPPPDWPEVVLNWEWILQSDNRIGEIMNWLETSPGGRYHLHGKGEERDFAFRFENPADATWFRMSIP